MKKLSGAMALLIVMPIWYYLFYQVLVRVNASELMMFLFWVYLPIGVVTQVLAKVASDA